jgi:eukaryotic-like serine/threonine-protein kinase
VSARIPASPKGLYDFGPFRLDCAKHLLLKGGKPLTLSPKAFEILVLLIERHGALVTKGDLLQAVWPETFVEENNLTQYISTLRKALGDGANGREYIETVPKLGYRFVTDVHNAAGDESELLVEKHTQTRIVVREEEQEVDGQNFDDRTSAIVSAGQGVPLAKPRAIAAVSARRAPLQNWRSRTWFPVSLAAILVLVAVALLLRNVGSSHSGENTSVKSASAIPGVVRPRYSIAVFGFRNLSGQAEDVWLSDALAEMLTTELAAGGQLRIVSGEDVQRMRADMKVIDGSVPAKATLIQLRNRVGADIAVSGSFIELGREPDRQIRLDLRMQDAVTGEEVFSTAVTGKTQELFGLISRSGAELRSKLGVPVLTDLESAEDQAALPSTPEAARLYSEGLAKLRVSDAPAAEKLLTLAVSSDTKFALGHSALASAWSALGYDEKAKTESRRALDLSLNLSREQHLLIAGQYAELTRDWSQAVATYEELFHSFPDNLDYGLRLANAQTFAGKGNDALATVDLLRRLPPPSNHEPQIDLRQADAAESLGDFTQENDAADHAIQSGENLNERLLVANAWTMKSWAVRRLGHARDAEQGLLQAKRIFAESGDLQGVGSAVRLIAGEQSEQGDYLQAKRSYDEAIKIFREIGDRRSLAQSINGLAIVQYEGGNLREAKALYRQYFEIETEVGSRINAAGALGNIANVADAQGDLVEAVHLNEESLKIFDDVGDHRAVGTALGNIAVLLYEQGDLVGAKKKFEEAIAIKQKIGYQRGIAYDLAGLGQVYRAQGDLSAAQKAEEESLEIRHRIGEHYNAEVSRLNLAILDLESQKPEEAEKIAADSALKFREEKSKSDEAAAEEIAARSLLALGRLDEAQTAVKQAKSLSRGKSNLPLSFDIADTAARISVALRNPPVPSVAASSRKSLESALLVARRCGYVEYQFKLGLALGENELKSGNISEGRTRLNGLAKDATGKGFLLVARQASAALQALEPR